MEAEGDSQINGARDELLPPPRRIEGLDEAKLRIRAEVRCARRNCGLCPHRFAGVGDLILHAPVLEPPNAWRVERRGSGAKVLLELEQRK